MKIIKVKKEDSFKTKPISKVKKVQLITQGPFNKYHLILMIYSIKI